MAFRPHQGDFPLKRFLLLGSAAAVKGGVCRFDAGTGYVEPAAAASAVIYGIFDRTVTAEATSGVTEVGVWQISGDQIWEVDTTGTPTQLMVGTIASLTDAVTLDEDDTGNTPIFEITGLGSGNRVRGSFNGLALTSIGV